MNKIIVIGAVAGGATVASQIRRLDSDSEIVVYEKDRDMSFANCGLPYYLGNVVEDRDYMLSATPEQFLDKKNITVKTFHEAIALNDQDKTIRVKNHQTGEIFEDHYDQLILSPGCRARQFPIESDRVFTLRNLVDTDKIEDFIVQNNVQKALVVGAGYISLEILENLHNRNIETTLIHRSDHINKSMDKDLNQVIFDELEKRQINYRLDEEIKHIENKTVTFKSGHVEDYDIIITGIGIEPNSDWLQTSQLKLNDRGYIPVNEYFETNLDDVYAIGDIIETFYRHTQQPTTVTLAWGAHRAASLVAENISSKSHMAKFKGLLGTNIVRFFDYALGSVGIAEHELENYDYTVIEQTQKQHAGYYPDAQPITLRVYFDNSTRKILRACAVGKDGVDKRIDILSTAIIGDLTVDDLRDIEIAYAPPFSSPKDIVNMIGYKAQ
ncbi:CoA-disulfide reductase [Mammaliicoccus sp. Dog046]|uniref:CoA-disulfide reductase n=1 Tax=Mammaliicoccus sp. Dog046 TaxID=3034233 RepID=UPI002B25EEC3|nr:CoA-disulfide reductase [Mammaliicoccus sp. Dog046]WQK84853.1 CoA-disulfide reductase [Mammaliicoccus sp. Dog046]